MRQRRHAIACTTSAVHQLPCVVTRKVEVLQCERAHNHRIFLSMHCLCMHVGSILKKVLLLLVRGALHEADRRAKSHKSQGETRACCHALSPRMMRRNIWRLETWRYGRQGKASQGKARQPDRTESSVNLCDASETHCSSSHPHPQRKKMHAAELSLSFRPALHHRCGTYYYILEWVGV